MPLTLTLTLTSVIVVFPAAVLGSDLENTVLVRFTHGYGEAYRRLRHYSFEDLQIPIIPTLMRSTNPNPDS